MFFLLFSPAPNSQGPVPRASDTGYEACRAPSASPCQTFKVKRVSIGQSVTLLLSDQEPRVPSATGRGCALHRCLSAVLTPAVRTGVNSSRWALGPFWPLDGPPLLAALHRGTVSLLWARSLGHVGVSVNKAHTHSTCAHTHIAHAHTHSTCTHTWHMQPLQGCKELLTFQALRLGHLVGSLYLDPLLC